MLTVLAQFKSKEDKIDQAKAALSALLEPTQQEEGCISYDLHQDHQNPSHFFLYENWQDKSLLDAHLQSPHLQAFLARQDELFAEPLQLTLAGKVLK